MKLCQHHNLPVDPIDGLCDKCAQFMFDNRLYSDRAMFMDECRDAADGGHIELVQSTFYPINFN